MEGSEVKGVDSVRSLDFTSIANVATEGVSMGWCELFFCFPKVTVTAGLKIVQKSPKVKVGKPDNMHSYNKYLELMVLSACVIWHP